MKRIFLVVLIVLFLCPTANAVPFINVVSQQYWIWGEGYGYWSEPFNYTYYDMTSSNPLYYDTGWISTGDQVTGAGAYMIRTSATGGYTENYAYLEAHVDVSDMGDAISFGQASASMVFQPLVNRLALHVEGSFYPFTNVYLINLTLNEIILDGFYANSSYLLDIDPNNNYMLRTQIPITQCSERTYSLNIRPVSEPSTMLLLASGLLGLAGFRKNFIKT